MKLVRFNNRFPQTNSLMNHFFGSEILNEVNGLHGGKQNSTPKVNITETDHDFIIEMAAPGYDKNDFNLSLENDVLSIEAVKEDKKEAQKYSHYEFNFSSFKRSFTLPENKVKEAKITAQYNNGILHISLPKKEEAKTQPKRLININ